MYLRTVFDLPDTSVLTQTITIEKLNKALGALPQPYFGKEVSSPSKVANDWVNLLEEQWSLITRKHPKDFIFTEKERLILHLLAERKEKWLIDPPKLQDLKTTLRQDADILQDAGWHDIAHKAFHTIHQDSLYGQLPVSNIFNFETSQNHKFLTPQSHTEDDWNFLLKDFSLETEYFEATQDLILKLEKIILRNFLSSQGSKTYLDSAQGLQNMINSIQALTPEEIVLKGDVDALLKGIIRKEQTEPSLLEALKQHPEFEGFKESEVWRLFIDGQQAYRGQYGFENEPGYMAGMLRTFKFILETRDEPVSTSYLIDLHDMAIDGVQPMTERFFQKEFRDPNISSGFALFLGDNITYEGIEELLELQDKDQRYVFEWKFPDHPFEKSRPQKDNQGHYLTESLGLMGRLWSTTSSYEQDNYEYSDQIICDYYDAIRVADTPDEKLIAIAKLCRNLETAHLFIDGNIRTVGILLLNKLLLENNLSPAALYNPNVFDGYSIEELVYEIKRGQAYFSDLCVKIPSEKANAFIKAHKTLSSDSFQTKMQTWRGFTPEEEKILNRYYEKKKEIEFLKKKYAPYFPLSSSNISPLVQDSSPHHSQPTTPQDEYLTPFETPQKRSPSPTPELESPPPPESTSHLEPILSDGDIIASDETARRSSSARSSSVDTLITKDSPANTQRAREGERSISEVEYPLPHEPIPHVEHILSDGKITARDEATRNATPEYPLSADNPITKVEPSNTQNAALHKSLAIGGGLSILGAAGAINSFKHGDILNGSLNLSEAAVGGVSLASATVATNGTVIKTLPKAAKVATHLTKAIPYAGSLFSAASAVQTGIALKDSIQAKDTKGIIKNGVGVALDGAMTVTDLIPEVCTPITLGLVVARVTSDMLIDQAWDPYAYVKTFELLKAPDATDFDKGLIIATGTVQAAWKWTLTGQILSARAQAKELKELVEKQKIEHESHKLTSGDAKDFMKIFDVKDQKARMVDFSSGPLSPYSGHLNVKIHSAHKLEFHVGWPQSQPSPQNISLGDDPISTLFIKMGQGAQYYYSREMREVYCYFVRIAEERVAHSAYPFFDSLTSTYYGPQDGTHVVFYAPQHPLIVKHKTALPTLEIPEKDFHYIIHGGSGKNNYLLGKQNASIFMGSGTNSVHLSLTEDLPRTVILHGYRDNGTCGLKFEKISHEHSLFLDAQLGIQQLPDGWNVRLKLGNTIVDFPSTRIKVLSLMTDTGVLVVHTGRLMEETNHLQATDDHDMAMLRYKNLKDYMEFFSTEALLQREPLITPIESADERPILKSSSLREAQTIVPDPDESLRDPVWSLESTLESNMPNSLNILDMDV